MESSTTIDTRPHASMRKGTHSCVECRRRKVRCLFSHDDPTSCITCRKKGKVCQEQRREHFPPVGGKKTSLKDRVAKLEALLKSSAIEIDDEELELTGQSDSPGIHEKTPDRSSNISAPPTISSATSASLGKEAFRKNDREDDSDDDEDYDPDPLISLFNNGVWQSQDPKGSIQLVDTFQLNLNQRVEAKRNHVLVLLKSTLISPYLLRDILNATAGWWQSWRPLGPWPIEYTTAAKFSTLQDFLMYGYNADNPAVVGLSMLCIAECLRRLSMPAHEELIAQLPRPPQELFQILFERVDRLINSDSDFANTKEGLDCLMMSAKTFQSLGLPKRSWLLLHRAIVYGQFMGLHRPSPLPGELKEDRHVRQNAWDNLCQTDLFLGITLGLPYIANGRNIPASYYGEPGSPMWFQRQVMDAAALVIDRNQSGLMNDEEYTLNVTKTLDRALSHMSPEFWEAPQQLKSGIGNRLQALEWTTKQMFYWIVRLFTHLPFSISSIEQPHLEGHRLACQAGCRGMLTVYHVLRSDRRADIVNLIDYQAFISSSILLLGLLGYGTSAKTCSQPEYCPDRDLVAATLQLLHETSTKGNNRVADEAVEGLESLYALIDPTQHHIVCAPGSKDIKTRITIPSMGVITIAPGDTFKRAHSTSRDPSPELPVFTFSNPFDFNSPPKQYHDPNAALIGQIPDNTGGLSSAQGLPMTMPTTAGNMVDTEFTSIDFEFDALMATNPGDWSWISGEIQPQQYH